MPTRRPFSRLLALVLACGALLGAVGVGAAQAGSAALRSAILLKALEYEKRVKAGSGELVIAVVAPASGKGADDASAMMSALDQVSRKGVAGRSTRIIRVKDGSLAVTEVNAKRADVVYVPAGLGASASPLAHDLSSQSLVLCGDPDDVGRGCALSVEAAGSGSRMVVDPSTAKRGGFEFDARLLRLARIVR